jgi:hypothetical protein
MFPSRRFKSLLFVFTLALVLGAATQALAQGEESTVPDKKFYVSGNLFGYWETADGGLSGSSYGGGATFGYFFRPTWTVNGEVAIPDYFTDDDDDDDLIPQQHRHIEFALLLGWHPARGTMRDINLLIGLTVLRVQYRSALAEDFSETRGALGVGIDWRIPLGETFALVPQARAHVTTGAFVFRGGVGLQVDF